ncbi:MAG: YlmH/Sll1252 family protein [bacterium]|nr:YlmH/Sll1252 family protein [bacterium]
MLEDKVLIAKIMDKHRFSITKNRIVHTDFLTMNEISIANRTLKEKRISNYVVYGGKIDSDRSIIIFSPEKFSIEMVEKNYDNIFKIVRIRLPNELRYEHRDYLSGIMKLGIRREKFGDIVVTENGADIICLEEISQILCDGLKNLIRFKKSEIIVEDIINLSQKENEFEIVKIIVPSLRLDNFVAEIARTSRNRAEEIIKEGRVFINSNCEYKDAKKIREEDVITIRGKGKFIFDSIERKTGSQRLVINLKKYK